MHVAGHPHPYPAPAYHTAYYPPPPAPHDVQLKRQYLALLPPQQIIEICLTFDIHVPPYVKSTVWPLDINAAISSLQKPPPASVGAENTSLNENRNHAHSQPSDKAVMDSLKTGTNGSSTSETTSEAQPPDKDPPEPTPTLTRETSPASVDTETPSRSSVSPSAEPVPASAPSIATNVSAPESIPEQQSDATENSAAAASNPVASVASTSTTPAPPTPAPPPPSIPAPAPVPGPSAAPTPPPVPPPPAPYPHQTYMYSQPAYPHTPYYHPPAGYPYGYPSYPSTYHHPHPHHHAPPPPPPPVYPPPPPPQASTYVTPYMQPHPGPGIDMPSDDLPSYEEMIVEALNENPDPEGCAPKDLFTWMASRYPLQSNFRPSASQALQKAFKRGRLEKGNNGKYRLSASWEGGSTSKKTTRRPQVQTPAAPPHSAPSSSSPFTHAPLIHHHHTPSHQPQPYNYPYGTYPGYPPPPASASVNGSSSQHAPATGGDTAAKTLPSSSSSSATTAAQDHADHVDTYEAAQAILKAINSGTLLQMPPEEPEKAPPGAGKTAMPPPAVPPLQDASQVMVGNGVEQLLSHLQSALANVAGPSQASSVQPDMTSNAGLDPTSPRGQLQAQLALLAAQLTEYANEEDHSHMLQHAMAGPPLPTQVAVSAPVPPAIPASVPEPQAQLAVPTPAPVAIPPPPIPQPPAHDLANPPTVELPSHPVDSTATSTEPTSTQQNGMAVDPPTVAVPDVNEHIIPLDPALLQEEDDDEDDDDDDMEEVI